jgi:hypothetical protein
MYGLHWLQNVFLSLKLSLYTQMGFDLMPHKLQSPLQRHREQFIKRVFEPAGNINALLMLAPLHIPARQLG